MENEDIEFWKDVSYQIIDEVSEAVSPLTGREKSGKTVKMGADGTPTKMIDIVAEEKVIKILKNTGKSVTLVSEEIGELKIGNGPSEVIFVVDPLDGTLNYAKRIPFFAVSIGVIINGEARAGAIYNPVLDELFVANAGCGARLNGEPIHVTSRKSLRGASVIFEWWNRESLIPDPLGLEKQLYGFTRSVRSPGSVALNLCAVASGRFDGMVTVFKKSPIYEIAAGCLIVQEAGGRVTNSARESWETYKGSVIAAGENIHAGILRVISGVGR